MSVVLFFIQARVQDIAGDYEERIDRRLLALRLLAAPYKEPPEVLERVTKLIEQVRVCVCLCVYVCVPARMCVHERRLACVHTRMHNGSVRDVQEHFHGFQHNLSFLFFPLSLPLSFSQCRNQ